ncbi:hypothetical protein QBC36DRAFT_360122 [Triangularia setosa]|uniref:Uncharacterized protein n=1 Tax=Triangularia setosa TaxID=2587417 RepID=A0AAN7A4U8_9PEZI|nr:hypothetical protein QBC36DRAFT_360122 [Podospora setosa]
MSSKIDTSQSSLPVTYDGFMATAAHNARNSQLYRIPEEPLAMIVGNFDDDPVTRLILGQVSNHLRRHVYSKVSPCSPPRSRSVFHEDDENTMLLKHLEKIYEELRDTSKSACSHGLREAQNPNMKSPVLDRLPQAPDHYGWPIEFGMVSELCFDKTLRMQPSIMLDPGHTSVTDINTKSHGTRSQRIEVSPCKRSRSRHGSGRQPCLVTKYSRVLGEQLLMGAQLQALGKSNGYLKPITPPHECLHAIDPCSYELNDDPEAIGNVWPVCHDVTCGNYYATSQLTHYSKGRSPLHL